MFIAIAIHHHAPEHAEEFGDFMHRVRETEGRGDLGKEVGRRGTPPIDLTPKRELYIHHTVTSSQRRTREDERRHMRELERVEHEQDGSACIGAPRPPA